MNRINLGGNLTVTNIHALAISNTSDSGANMVLDLGSHTFDAASDPGFTGSGGITILADAGGGTFASRTIAYGSDLSVTGANVTLVSKVGGSPNILRGTFHETTTFQVLGLNNAMFLVTATANTFANAPGQLIVGNGTTATSLRMNLASTSASLQIRGDVSVTDNATILFANNNTSNQIRVGGNFTDLNTTGTYTIDGSNNAIIFNGSPSSAREVDIRRPDVETRFEVGRSDTDFGWIRLEHDLTTLGSFLVRENSTFDLATHTLTADTFTAQSDGSLAFSFGGAGNGLVAVDGLLTLPVNLGIDITAIGGPITNPVTLFTFGTYSGPSDFSTWTLTGDLPDGWNAALVGDSIMLVPEPSAIALLAAGAGLLALRRFRRTSATRRLLPHGESQRRRQ